MKKYNLLEMGFYISIFVKGFDALLEFIGGIALIVVDNAWLRHTLIGLTAPEIIEDPQDALMHYIIQLGAQLSIGMQHSLAVYLAFHGIVKLIVVILLWKKQLWAYIPAVIVFLAFALYELYEFSANHSIPVLIFSVIDIAIVLLIIVEYRRIKGEQPVEA